MSVYKEVPDRSNNDSSLEMGLLKTLQICFVFSSGCKAAGFHGSGDCKAVGFQCSSGAIEKGRRMGQIKTPQTSHFLKLRFSFFLGG